MLFKVIYKKKLTRVSDCNRCLETSLAGTMLEKKVADSLWEALGTTKPFVVLG